MPDFPKIVRARLQAVTPGQDHPDPDLLTAFSERSLSPVEQAGLLEHLSRCAECREVVALALPASEALQPRLQVSGGSRFSWPVFRWAFVSAGIAALAVFGFVEYGHHESTVRMAKNTPAPTLQKDEPRAASAEAQGESAADRQESTESTGKTASAAAPTEVRNQPSPPESRLAKTLNIPAARGPLPHGPRLMSQAQQQMSQAQQQTARAFRAAPGILNAPESKQSVPPHAEVASGANEIVEVQSANAEPQSQAVDSVMAANRGVSPTTSDAEVSRAKSASVGPASAQASPAPLPLQARSVRAARIDIPTWTINGGRLQRSFDQGLTWEDVNVTANPDTEASLELAVAARKVAKESSRKDKKTSIAPVFRAVSANGTDVWAGGTGAALYHSIDAGAHWTRLIPASPGATITGDIVSLDFPDPQNGRIATSTGEVWTTADEGRSWQKQ